MSCRLDKRELAGWLGSVGCVNVARESPLRRVNRTLAWCFIYPLHLLELGVLRYGLWVFSIIDELRVEY